MRNSRAAATATAELISMGSRPGMEHTAVANTSEPAASHLRGGRL